MSKACPKNYVSVVNIFLSLLSEKYEYIGKLLKPGEQPTEYSDEEDAKDTKAKKDE